MEVKQMGRHKKDCSCKLCSIKSKGNTLETNSDLSNSIPEKQVQKEEIGPKSGPVL